MNKLCEDVLVISSANSFSSSSFKASGYCVQTPFNGGKSKISRIFRGLHIRMNLPRQKRLYNEQYLSQKWKLIIVIEGALTTPPYLRWLCQKAPDSKILLLYNNPISRIKNPWLRPLNKGMNPKLIRDTRIVSWTFDPGDAELYGIRFYQTLGEVNTSSCHEDYWYDAVFVGLDKGRKKALLKLESSMKEQGLNPYIHIVSEKSMFWNRNRIYKDRLPYEKVKELMQHSRCVIDFLQKGQTGVSMRTSESMAQHIKVITNTPYAKKCAYYDSRNIFILGEDDMNGLRDFLYSPFVPVDPEIIDGLALEKQIEQLLYEYE